MKISSLILCALALCVTHVATSVAASSRGSFLRPDVAALRWQKDGKARAVFIFHVEGGPRPVYLEAVLPLPDGTTSPDRLKKAVTSRESRSTFEGPSLAGWRPGEDYVFRLNAYSDSGYTHLIESVDRKVVCSKPPHD